MRWPRMRATRWQAVLAAGLALAIPVGCGSDQQASSSSSAGSAGTASPAGTPSTPASSQLTTSFDHLGPATVGMPAPRFAAALGRRLQTPSDSGNSSCWQREMTGLSGVSLMVFDNPDSAVVRVDINDPGIRTASGVGIGSTEDQIRRGFPSPVEIQPHPYVPGGHYLVVHSGPSDLLFETDDAGTVTSYRFGDKGPVGYIEGCL